MASTNCSCGASWTDLGSVLLAAAAFVVAVITLWITALRRPKVEVDRLHDDGQLLSGGMHSDGRPTGPHIYVHVFVANTGATGTVVSRFDVTDFQERNAGPPLWSGIAGLDLPIGQPVAIPLERDDGKTFPLAVHLETNSDPPSVGPDDFARRLRALESVSVTLRWEWRRPKFPNMRRRERAPGHEIVTIAGEQFRAHMVANWRGNPTFAHLVEIAESRDAAG